jgi:hypothetical protein
LAAGRPSVEIKTASHINKLEAGYVCPDFCGFEDPKTKTLSRFADLGGKLRLHLVVRVGQNVWINDYIWNLLHAAAGR